MEGGLDDTDLLTLGSPKIKTLHSKQDDDDEEEDDKENVDSVDFVRPRNPSPKKPLRVPSAGTLQSNIHS